MLKKPLLFSSLASALFFTSCSTDFDILAPYEEYTIVFGLLDKSENTHYIKVNKSFLGDGSAYDYALIKDSSEYAKVSGTIEEWSAGGSSPDFIYTLDDTTITNKDSGTFYYPDQTVYYFTSSTLNENKEYRLNLNINEGKKYVYGKTKLVKSFSFGTLIQSTALAFGAANSVGDYNNVTINYFTNGGKRYDTWLRFRYDEVTISGTTRKEITWKIGSYVPANPNTSEEVVIVYPGENFYQSIANRVPALTPDIVKRKYRAIDIVVVAASDDLHTYMEVNSPQTGLVQDRPSFTNIENGIGIFSSRFTNIIKNKTLNANSLQELCNGQHTGPLGFCSDSLAFGSYSFYCN